MLSEKRDKFKGLSQKTGHYFSKFRISPNQYTLISLIFIIASFFFLVRANFILALVFFFISAFLDFIDGAVAKFSNRETKKGAYLDTICDRYVEGIILLGFLFLPLSSFILPAEIWIFLALFGGLLTTYAKAAAKEKELTVKEIKNGLCGRPERIILITLALFLGILNLSWIIYPITVLAIFSNFTALQRIFLSIKVNQRFIEDQNKLKFH
jgi:archaetidylinositol phosphate synthase